MADAPLLDSLARRLAHLGCVRRPTLAHVPRVGWTIIALVEHGTIVGTDRFSPDLAAHALLVAAGVNPWSPAR